MAHKYLLLVCYVVAVCDLLHALYFTVYAILWIIKGVSLNSGLALFATIFWVMVSILLLVGLWKSEPNYISIWLLFAFVGFILDIIVFIYALFYLFSFDKEHIKRPLMYLFALILEFICMYIIFTHLKIIKHRARRLARKRAAHGTSKGTFDNVHSRQRMNFLSLGIRESILESGGITSKVRMWNRIARKSPQDAKNLINDNNNEDENDNDYELSNYEPMFFRSKESKKANKKQNSEQTSSAPRMVHKKHEAKRLEESSDGDTTSNV